MIMNDGIERSERHFIHWHPHHPLSHLLPKLYKTHTHSLSLQNQFEMFQFSKPLKKWLGRGGQEQESGGGEEVESSSSGTGTGGGGAEVAPFLVRTDDDGDIRKQKVKEDDDERVAAAEMDDLVLYGVSSAVSSTGAGVASALPYHDDEEDDDDDMLDLDLAKAGLEECESSIEDSAFGADDILKIGMAYMT